MHGDLCPSVECLSSVLCTAGFNTCMSEQTCGWTAGGWMCGRVGGRMGAWGDGQAEGGWVGRWMDGRLGRWTDGRMDECMRRWMDVWMDRW